MGSERLRRAMVDPRGWLDDEPAARAAYLLCRHVIDQIDEAARAAHAPVLLVKGAALAHSVYPRPWLREMGDIDVVVHPADRAAFEAALGARRFVPTPPPAGRSVSAPWLGDAALRYVHGAALFSVDVHARLDKLVSRPIPYGAIRARSVAIESLGTLRAPCHEDHVLLVALHASSSDLDHPQALIDLELLLGAGADQPTIADRAGRWRLRSALHVCLTQLVALGSARVSDALLRATHPGSGRRSLLARAGYLAPPPDPPDPTAAGGPLPRHGARWVAHQTPLRDDLGRWAFGLGRYGALRLADALAARFMR